MTPSMFNPPTDQRQRKFSRPKFLFELASQHHFHMISSQNQPQTEPGLNNFANWLPYEWPLEPRVYRWQVLSVHEASGISNQISNSSTLWERSPKLVFLPVHSKSDFSVVINFGKFFLIWIFCWLWTSEWPLPVGFIRVRPPTIDLRQRDTVIFRGEVDAKFGGKTGFGNSILISGTCENVVGKPVLLRKADHPNQSSR